MAKFGALSKERLATCHEDLQVIASLAIQYLDFSVECGHRGQEEQDEAFMNGFSKLQYPNSKHNKTPSMAIDITPYPSRYTDTKKQRELAFYFKGIADALFAEGRISHRVRWGGDWDGDGDTADQTFNDYPHFELMED